MRLTRRQFLWAPAPLLVAQPARRNVLFIAVDDLNNRLGCYGDPLVKSPHIDRLATRGVRFDHAYCQYPLCNPSRTSLLSGKRPDTTQIFDNTTPPRTSLGNVTFLPEYFRKHGYFTARVGKIAHGKFEDTVTWDISEGSGPGERMTAADGEGGAGKLEWRMTSGPDESLPDGRTARRIVQILEQRLKAGGPWFLGAGFHRPHLPWVAPKKYFDLYPPDKIELPKTPANDRDDIPPVALTRTPGDDAMTDADRRQAIAAYHACTSFTDAQVGVLFEALDRHRLWDNTVVLLFGDHGWHLYDHLGLWRKMTVFEESARAPLMVWAAGIAHGGCSRMVEFVDIYPTLAELCGLPPPEGMEGLSFVPLLKDPQRPWKKAAYTQVARGRRAVGRSVRTDRYRYTEWGANGVELYDHELDIHEWTNLAGSAKAAKAESEMRRLLKDGWRAALPAVAP